jgi:hypothetical protein
MSMETPSGLHQTKRQIGNKTLQADILAFQVLHPLRLIDLYGRRIPYASGSSSAAISPRPDKPPARIYPAPSTLQSDEAASQSVRH